MKRRRERGNSGEEGEREEGRERVDPLPGPSGL